MSEPIITPRWFDEYIGTHTPEEIGRMVGRALVVLFRNQTEDERTAAHTIHANGRGFQSCDAQSGTVAARHFLKHGRLEQWMTQQWIRPTGNHRRPRIAKYHRQLDAAAQIKRGR